MTEESEQWMKDAASLADDYRQGGDMAGYWRVMRAAEDRCDREAKADRQAKGRK